MIIEYVRYRIAEGRRDDFVKAYQQAAEWLEASAYCLGYELSQCEEEPDRFILRIQWTSTDDHMGKFRKSEEFKAFLPLIRPFIDDLEEMQHYQLTPVVSVAQSG